MLVVDGSGGAYRVVKSFGSSKDRARIRLLKIAAQRFIDDFQGQTSLAFGDDDHSEWFDQIFESITKVRLLGPELVLGKLFNEIGFDRIEDLMFRHLVISRIINPSSKLKTVRYLAEYSGVDVDISSIYRYLDRLLVKHKPLVEQISYEHTRQVLGGVISMVFYDVTTIYFEAEQEDDLRISGYSKDGKNTHPQVLLGLLVSASGYPLAYDVFSGNTFEGHTMIPVIEHFISKYKLDRLVVVADAGLLSEKNITALMAAGHKFILGARIKAETEEVKQAILCKKIRFGSTRTIEKAGAMKLVVSRSKARAKKDAHNRAKGLARLEKSLKRGKLGKANVNNRGYNKYLKIEGEINVSIDYAKYEKDAAWDGLKGYLTNTDLAPKELIDSYKQLWKIEKAFRISKTDLRIRPIYHRLHRRIEAHICLSFAAYKVYKELERQLGQKRSVISVERAIECMKTIYGITMKHPSGQVKTKIYTSSDDQNELLRLFGIRAKCPV